MPTTPTGRRVVVSELAETPVEAMEKFIRVEPMDPPDVNALGPRDVLVRIESASVGWVDLIMTSGQYQHVPSPPYTPGLEYAGVVVWRGEEAANKISIGNRVMVDGLLAGPRSLGEYRRWGGWASYAVAPAEAILPVPTGMSFDEACNLLGNYETAYHCLLARGRLRAGETVLVLGASGSVGLAAVHVAKLVGAKVIAMGRSEAKLAEVAAEGADHVVVTRKEEGVLVPFRDQIKALTGGRGVDLVYDGVGGDLSLESLRCTAFGARVLIVGWAATPYVAKGKGGRGAPNANVLPTNLIMMKGLDVLGCPTVLSTVQDPSIRAPRLAQVLEWANAGKLRPRVSHRFALSEIVEAMKTKWNGDVVGGCVVTPNSEPA
ncbi:MAG: NADPH:quinone oxidoreductase family protein [Polyangiaceae bacterium]|nr:NADPH:quinone oxidoreductase family protein [Polyangiaceae bacterium]